MTNELFFYGHDFENEVRHQLNIFDRAITRSDALKVKNLCFAECEFLKEDLKTLYLFENLEELIYEQYDGVIDFKIFTPLKKLQSLLVGGKYLCDVKLINVGELKELPFLDYLSIGDFGTLDLSGLNEVQQLKELLIGWGDKVINHQEIGALKNLKSLELYDLDLQSLDFINKLNKNTKLDFCEITVK